MTQRVSSPGTGGCLPGKANVGREFLARVQRDYEKLATQGLPLKLEAYLLEEYGADVSTEYAGLPVRNPWGKASGQLSMNLRQVQEDLDARLGFVVLKTVIAQNESGLQSMDAWAVREARMDVETILGRDGEPGWTVTWKGRGWWQSFDEYLDLVRQSQAEAVPSGTLIVPSCKFHLPGPDEVDWRIDEYEFSTRALLTAWLSGGGEQFSAMPLEKDFSPTLAGSDRATARARIVEWLQRVPVLIRNAVSPATGTNSPVRVGLKVFNAMFEDDFQLELLDTIHAALPADRADFFVYGNRLFDPDREFAGHRGVAYGGPDLSDRNLRVMAAFAAEMNSAGRKPIPWSATGNICSGKMAIEYALLGATTFQLHTYFQLPLSEYVMSRGTRTQRALHELYFHPERGYLTWLEHIRQSAGSDHLPTIRDLPSLCEAVKVR
ncbi:hypothetical protein GC176_26540 [bacterium]|nr:hypothetical protein [bacterium]